jgi:hypothetical protein
MRSTVVLPAGGLPILNAIFLLGLTVGSALPQIETTSQPKFEVASIKPSNAGSQPNSNFPLGPGDVYIRNGGFFSATCFPLAIYVFFAYRLNGNQAQYVLPQLPEWAKTERFDIQARAEGNPSKDRMRLMMRSLLADRCKMTARYEPREFLCLRLFCQRAERRASTPAAPGPFTVSDRTTDILDTAHCGWVARLLYRHLSSTSEWRWSHTLRRT